VLPLYSTMADESDSIPNINNISPHPSERASSLCTRYRSCADNKVCVPHQFPVSDPLTEAWRRLRPVSDFMFIAFWMDTSSDMCFLFTKIQAMRNYNLISESDAINLI
jgi:hypothetical protein